MWKFCVVLVILAGRQVAALDGECGCDLCLLVDESGSINENYWDDAVDFLEKFALTLDIGPSDHQVALMKFNSTRSEVFSMLENPSTQETADAISGISMIGGGTNIEQAIPDAMEYCFGANSGERDWAPNVLLIVTDGIFSLGSDHIYESDEARAAGTLVLAVGIDVPHVTAANNIKDLVKNDAAYYWINTDMDSNVFLGEVSEAYQRICDGCRVDVCFVIDESGSISSDDWDAIQDFMVDLVSNYAIGFNHMLAGVVEFNQHANFKFDLDDYPDRPDLVAKLANLVKNGGGTKVFRGIDKARTECFGPNNGDRPDAPNIMIVITDGGHSDFSTAVASAQAASNEGIIMISIGVGSMLDSSRVADLSLNVPGRYFEPVNGDFSTIFNAITSLVDGICDDDCILDLCFLADESGSIDYPAEWYFMKTFMMGLVTQMHISPTGINVGLVEYQSWGTLQFDTREYLTIGPLLAAISGTTYDSGLTYLWDGIKTAREECFTDDRVNIAPRVLVIMSDGGDFNYATARAEADAAKNDGILIITISVGSMNQYDADFLDDIASDGDGHVYTAPNQFSWVPLIGTFEGLYRERWCPDVVACYGEFAGQELWDFEGNTLDLPEDKVELFRYQSSSSSQCKVQLTWDRNADPWPERWVSIHVGVHPVNSNKYYRQVDMARLTTGGDKPSQRGWKCKTGLIDESCPGQNGTITSYDYPINDLYSQDKYAEVQQIVEDVHYRVVQTSDCGEDPSMNFELNYFFQPNVGKEVFKFTINQEFYEANKNSMTGYCVP